ncbi:LPXTG-site transpeptidase (sortase) family protein [Streptacidiphilus sp. MAP12-33]|uniref:class F sortase n=1 Tax=Streptacidiphilus sp. MAP12-33 TaxID=3156266 RepID=UPI003511E37F
MPDQLTCGGGRRRAAATGLLLAVALLSQALAGCGTDHPRPAAGVAAADAAHGPSLPSGTPAATASASPGAPAPAMAASVPVRIVISRLGVNAPLMSVGRADDGTVATPPYSVPNTAGWFSGSVTPGQEGTAVVVGHVDTHTGPAVFYPLTSVRKGDTVQVQRTDRTTATFTVDDIQVIPRDDFDEDEVYANTGRPELRVITCGGVFDRATQEYSSNVVVYAHLTTAP